MPTYNWTHIFMAGSLVLAGMAIGVLLFGF